MHKRLTLLLLLVATALGGCAAENYLEGSVSKQLSLDFDELRLRKQSGFLLLEYVRRSFEAAETVCKLAADVTAVQGGDTLEGQDFLQRVTLSRATIERTVFPDAVDGRLELDELDFEHGGKVSGTFYVLFENDLTLEGGFAGRLVEIQIEP